MKHAWIWLAIVLIAVSCCAAVAEENYTPASDFSYIIRNNAITITGFTGSDTEVIIPPEIEGLPVTAIGNNAFESCTQLTSVLIPQTVTSIGLYAFQNCSRLISISIPNQVTHIGSHAFQGCASLSSIALPNSLSYIDNYVFQGCAHLSSVIIAGSITSIGSYAFRDCSSLASIIIPVGVTYIGKFAFTGCSNLTSITIPDSVTSIGNNTFYNCSSLTSITIPDSVTSIGVYAFSGCSSLTSITIPDGVTSIGEYTFYGCSSLTSITTPDGVTSIGVYAFSGCSSLTSITIPNGVTSIGNSAFYGCSGLTSITIPHSVTSIGSGTFYGCSGLRSITIPDGVTSIDDYAFSCCSGLTSITIPDGVTSIGDSAFYGCSNLSSISIPDGVTSISNNAFNGCSGLTSISIPDGVTSIGYNAFSECSGLTSIMIPDSVTSIGNSAFSGCSSLTSITIPDGTTSLGNSAFYGCTNLTSISIPDGVTSIGSYAFHNCYHLSSITIPDGVISIGERAFIYAKRVYLPESVQSFGEWPISSYAVIYCHEYSEADYWAQENGYTNIIYVDGDALDQNRYLTLSTDSLTIPRGKSIAVTPYVFPDIGDPAVTWESDNPSVATVEDGVVSAVGRGTATITATVGSASATLSVTGYVAPESFSLPEEEWVQTKKTLQLAISDLQPEDADAVVAWTSADTTFATIDENGLVTAKRPGTVSITATIGDLSRECLLHVCYPVSDISFDSESVSIPAQQAFSLTAHVTAGTETVDNHLVAFTSSDESVATVDENGLVHALKAGTVTITATAESGVSASIVCIVPPCEIHTPVAIAGVLPTAETTGLTPGSVCAVCGTVLVPREVLTSVTTLSLPSELTAIGEKAFEKAAMQYVILPDHTESVGSRAFAEAESLFFVRIPAGIAYIAPDAFDGCGPLTFTGALSDYARQYAEDHGIAIEGNE